MKTIHKNSIKELKNYITKSYADTSDKEMPGFLFRGQTKGYGNIKSSFARVAHDHVLRGQSYTIYRYAAQILRGLYGYSIKQKEAVAILQHYGMPTPQIDLTFNMDVAIFMATEEIIPNELPRIYVINTSKVTDDLILTNHLFLINNPENDGLNNRWYRQDGYAIMSRDWISAIDAEGLDLYNSKYSQFIECITFDQTDRENILYTRNDIYNNKDDIPRRVKAALTIFCESQFGDELHVELKGRIQNIDK